MFLCSVQSNIEVKVFCTGKVHKLILGDMEYKMIQTIQFINL